MSPLSERAGESRDIVDTVSLVDKKPKEDKPVSAAGAGMLVASGVATASSGVDKNPNPELILSAGVAAADPPASLSSFEGDDRNEKALGAAATGEAGASTGAGSGFKNENPEDAGTGASAAGAGEDDRKEKALALGAAAVAGATSGGVSSFFLSDPFTSKPPNMLDSRFKAVESILDH